MRKRTPRTIASLGLAGVMLGSLAVMATVAFGTPKPTAAQYQYKVLVCHRTHSQKKPWHLISVSAAAVPAHLRHGDTLAPPCPPVQVAAATASTKGHGKGKGKNQGKGHSGSSSGTSTTTTTTSTTTSSSPGNGNGNGKGNGR